jgi:hypothetical protein
LIRKKQKKIKMPPKSKVPKSKAEKNKPKSKADKEAERKKRKDKEAAKLAAAGGTVPNSNNDKPKGGKKK